MRLAPGCNRRARQVPPGAPLAPLAAVLHFQLQVGPNGQGAIGCNERSRRLRSLQRSTQSLLPTQREDKGKQGRLRQDKGNTEGKTKANTTGKTKTGNAKGKTQTRQRQHRRKDKSKAKATATAKQKDKKTASCGSTEGRITRLQVRSGVGEGWRSHRGDLERVKAGGLDPRGT